MKKSGTIFASISLSLLLLVAGAWAADLTLTDSVGPDLVYSMSPNVVMDYAPYGSDKYAITSVNTKGTMEYGIVSDYSGYYQHVNEAATNATTAANGTIVGWTKFGSSS